MKKLCLLLAVLITGYLGYGQENNVEAFEKENLNWYNKDRKKDKVLGTSVEKAYKSLLKNRTARDTVIVAVIDGGVDILHEDLAGRIWLNKEEIPNNQIDDDHNGYIDDIHGWNFLGNNSGDNISYENLEFTRILKSGQDSTKEYLKAWEFYEKEFKDFRDDSILIATFEGLYYSAKSIIREKTGIEVNNLKDLKQVKGKEQTVLQAKKFLKYRYSNGFSEKMLDQMKKQNEESVRYHLNMNYNPRNIVGDNPDDFNDRYYGNNDVAGPDPNHGTAVAGLIASIRDNGKGINGIATHIQIMPLRVVPEGDERDKDIALAIIYAVDHGARIINMSFGKRFSPHKDYVDHAIRYAEKNNVLLVMAAGNVGENLDENDHFPCDRYMDGIEVSNLITVGATTMKYDKNLAAEFSNYSRNQVDIFAPGQDIITLEAGNVYNKVDGTSFSAPVVSGIAAVLLAYFPQLSATELIDILIEGSVKITKPVVKPGQSEGDKSTVSFNELCRSGGVVNLFHALEIAEGRYGN